MADKAFASSADLATKEQTLELRRALGMVPAAAS